MQEYWEVLKNDALKMKCFFDYVVKSTEDMKADNPNTYWKIRFDIHQCLFGKHFDKSLANEAVSEMKNVDGTHGEHWTKAQTDSLISANKLQVNACDFYYVMNMMYSDYKEILGNDANTYVKMSLAYIEDPDAGDGKVFNLWKSRFFC